MTARRQRRLLLCVPRIVRGLRPRVRHALQVRWLLLLMMMKRVLCKMLLRLLTLLCLRVHHHMLLLLLLSAVKSRLLCVVSAGFTTVGAAALPKPR